MATVKVKRRHTTGGTASIVDGELSVNSFDKKIFIGNGTSAVELANQIGYSTITTLGTITTGTWNANTIATLYGGTGLNSFTSGGLMYASSTSALTTGSVFKITTGTNKNALGIASAAIKSGQSFEVSEPTLNSNASFGILADGNGGFATYGQAYMSLQSNNSASYITLSSNNDSGTLTIRAPHTTTATNGSISSFLNDWDSNVGIIEIVDNPTAPYVIFGTDSAGNYVKTRADALIMEIKAVTLQINTSIPEAGKILTCTSSDGTTEWQSNTAMHLTLFNMGII